MNRVKHIELNLDTFKIALQFDTAKDPLILHFDTPSRKFYLSLIALIVYEMKQNDQSEYVHLQKHEQLLRFLDNGLAGPHASKTINGMWEKIRKAWNYSLPNLEEAAHFKIEGRDLKPPLEKGGKYIYECTDVEKDTWAIFFGIDDVFSNWRFRFALDSDGGSLTNVTLKLKELRDGSAWNVFLKQLEESTTKELSKDTVVQPPKKRWPFYAVAAITFIILFVGGATILNRYIRPNPNRTNVTTELKTSIAVLPFINVSEDSDKDYFCDGITEELINSLSNVKDLRVISRTSAFYFKNKGFDLRTIGEKLSVDNILEGSVRVSGDNLKISAQLINVADDSHLWSENYDRNMKDIFETQEDLARNITCSLKSKLGCKQEEVIAKRYTDNYEAYNLYLKGRYFSTKHSYNEAVEKFQQAISLDPDYALAYTGLADVYNNMAFFYSESVNDYYLRSKEAVLKAIDIDKDLPEAYASLGYLKFRYEWDWKGAEKALRQAIELNPGNVLSHRYYSSYLRAVGRLDESLDEIKKALELDPLSRGVNARVGIILQCKRQFAEAVNHLEGILELYPNHPMVLIFLGSSYAHNGEIEKGIATLDKATRLTKRKSPLALGILGYTYGLAGKISEAEEILKEALQRVEEGNFSSNFIALIYTGMGNKDKAFEWLERAYEKRDPRIYPIKTMANFKSLNSDPRWTEFMKKLGLEG